MSYIGMSYKALVDKVALSLNAEDLTYAGMLNEAKKNEEYNKLSEDKKPEFIRDVLRSIYFNLEIKEYETADETLRAIAIPSLCPDTKLTESQIELGVRSPNPLIRTVYAIMPDITLTPDQFDALLNDKDEPVLFALLQRSDIKLNEVQTEYMLENNNWYVAQAFALNGGVSLSKDQVKDRANKILESIPEDSTNNSRLFHLKRAFESHLDDSIRKGDMWEFVMEEYIRKVRAAEQSSRKFKIIDIISAPFIYFHGVMVDNFMKSDDLITRLVCASSKNARLSNKQVDKILSDPEENPIVKLALINRDDIVLTPSQIEAGLNDPNSRIRRGIVNKSGVELTKTQVRRGLTDDSKLVKLAFAVYTQLENSYEQEVDMSFGKKLLGGVSNSMRNFLTR